MLTRSLCLGSAALLLACSSAGDAARSPTPELGPEPVSAPELEPEPEAPAPEPAPEAPAAPAAAPEPAPEPAPAAAPEPAPAPAMGFRVAAAEKAHLVQAVLARWSAASCLDLELTTDGPHEVLFTTEGFTAPHRIGQTTGTWEAAIIRVRDEGWLNYQIEIVLMHELAHLLAITNDHVDNSVLSETDGFADRNLKISDELLTRVCERRTCGCFNPES